jgi:hypothetical protein
MDGQFIALKGSAQQGAFLKKHATTTLSSFVALGHKKVMAVFHSLSTCGKQVWKVDERQQVVGHKHGSLASGRHICI